MNEILFGGELIVVSILINALLLYVLWKALIYRMNLKPLIQSARQFRTILGEHSQKIQHDRKQVIKNKVTETKLLDGLIQSLPMGNAIKSVMEQKGLNGIDVFEALQDENFVKGIMVLYKTFGGLIQKITGKEDKAEQPYNQNKEGEIFQ